MTAMVDRTGDRYGALTVLRRASGVPVKWTCRCDCGEHVDVRASNLQSGNTASCGCLTYQKIAVARTKHGQGKRGETTREYHSWCSMIARCCNPSNHKYPYYGGRGIAVCERWRNDFAAFFADMGPRPPGTTLDRIDNNGNYEPGNCRWATASEQSLNRRPRSEWNLREGCDHAC